MNIWIGIMKDEKFVREWTGHVSDADDAADAVRETLLDYAEESDEPVWGLTVKIDQMPKKPEGGEAKPKS
jgi:hypothetical protein